MINEQKAVPLRTGANRELRVQSVFSTIQGEGPYGGMPAIFVRLYGCNLQCPACDTDYTSNNEPMTPNELVSDIHEFGNVPLVVITGGEPFRQKEQLRPFVDRMRRSHIVQIETNGTYYDQSIANMANVDIVISPKTAFVHVSWKLKGTLDNVTWKYVLDHKHVDHTDGLPSDVLRTGIRPARPPAWMPNHKVFLQPIDMQDEEYNKMSQDCAVKSAMMFGYRFNLQVHKLINFP